MKYLIVAVINAIYGILLFLTLKPDTPGVVLIIFIAGVLTILGLSGFFLWLWRILAREQTSQPSPAMKSWYQLAKGIDILLILGLLFRAFILQPFVVEGNSMETNFHNKEFLLVDRISYKFREPQRGDVIIFRFPRNQADDYIKRIIGLPGETVRIQASQVFINNQIIYEDYLQPMSQTLIGSDPANFLEKTLGSEEYFVMGDNRSNSSDSRDWGMVPKANLIGRAWLTVYPFQNFSLVQKAPFRLEYSSL